MSESSPGINYDALREAVGPDVGGLFGHERLEGMLPSAPTRKSARNAPARQSDSDTVGVQFSREKGSCRGSDPDLFYPEDDEDPAEEVKAICGGCDFATDCLEYAIAAREKLGVWGGYTARERRRLIRQRRRAAGTGN